jgi:hypothetical protein
LILHTHRHTDIHTYTDTYTHANSVRVYMYIIYGHIAIIIIVIIISTRLLSKSMVFIESLMNNTNTINMNRYNYKYIMWILPHLSIVPKIAQKQQQCPDREEICKLAQPISQPSSLVQNVLQNIKFWHFIKTPGLQNSLTLLFLRKVITSLSLSDYIKS